MFCGAGCQGSKRAESAEQHGTVDSPLQIQLVKMLGLKNYVLDKFVFRRKQPTYSIYNINNSSKVFVGKQQYVAPDSYVYQAAIIQAGNLSVPVLRLTPNNHSINQTLPCIIYAHGNSSDMGDSLFFVSKFAEIYRAEFITFDYTGYGVSRQKEVGEEIICRDLELVLAWANRPLENIVLWGFSLGTFPVTYNAAKYKVKGCILQCPIGSLSCMFYDEYAENVKFKDDHFANIDHIGNVRCKILMMHSQADEIIPIQQARLLYNKFISKNKDRTKDISFIEVEKIKHNSFHRFIASPIDNDLQKEVFQFLYDIQADINQTVFSFNSTLGTDISIQLPEMDQELLNLAKQLKKVQFQQHYFNEQHFQLIELQDETEDKHKRKVRLDSWLCCNK